MNNESASEWISRSSNTGPTFSQTSVCAFIYLFSYSAGSGKDSIRQLSLGRCGFSQAFRNYATDNNHVLLHPLGPVSACDKAALNKLEKEHCFYSTLTYFEQINIYNELILARESSIVFLKHRLIIVLHLKSKFFHYNSLLNCYVTTWPLR